MPDEVGAHPGEIEAVENPEEAHDGLLLPGVPVKDVTAKEMAIDVAGVLVGDVEQGGVGVGDVAKEPLAKIHIVLVAAVGDFLADESLVLADADEEQAGDKDVDRLQAELGRVILGHWADLVLPTVKVFDQGPDEAQLYQPLGPPADEVGEGAVELTGPYLEVGVVDTRQVLFYPRPAHYLGHELVFLYATALALDERFHVPFQRCFVHRGSGPFLEIADPGPQLLPRLRESLLFPALFLLEFPVEGLMTLEAQEDVAVQSLYLLLQIVYQDGLGLGLVRAQDERAGRRSSDFLL